MLVALGWLVLVSVGADVAAADPVTPANISEPDELWQLTLSEAVDIGLDNSDSVRVLAPRNPPYVPNCFGPPQAVGVARPTVNRKTVIGRVDRDAPAWRFKVEAAGLVRSIEERYWNLAQQHQELWAIDKAVELTGEVLKREQHELWLAPKSEARAADVAEVEERLIGLHRRLVATTAEMVDAERRLRAVLGLPLADNRRIVPVSAPTIKKIAPRWDECLASMNAWQPVLVDQTERALQAEWLAATMLRAQAESETPAALEFTAFAEDRLQTARAMQQKLLQHLEHQARRALARSFIAVDAKSKRLQAAQQKLTDARERLTTEGTFYEEGRISVARYLDAIDVFCGAVADEGQAKYSYNVSLAKLADATGTLLSARDIEVRDWLPRRLIPARDPALKAAAHEEAPSAPAARH